MHTLTDHQPIALSHRSTAETAGQCTKGQQLPRAVPAMSTMCAITMCHSILRRVARISICIVSVLSSCCMSGPVLTSISGRSLPSVCIVELTWSSCDGGQQLESRGCLDDLGPLRKVQLAVCQQGHQSCQHLWWRQVQVLYDQPLALCHSLHSHGRVSQGCHPMQPYQQALHQDWKAACLPYDGQQHTLCPAGAHNAAKTKRNCQR